MNYPELTELLKNEGVLKNNYWFDWLAKRTDYPKHIKAGKYEIREDMNLVAIIRMLKNGRQSPVNLVITKLRTREDLASLVGKKFECDSAAFISFLNNKDSMAQYGLDSNTVMTAVFPETYTYFWNSNASRIFKKLDAFAKIYWTPEKIQAAKQRGLTPVTAYILASIIEEETNKNEDKSKIASVYLNRLKDGMKLAADPTIKFALRNFELKRIYDKYLTVESPYNTYKYPGLPPGPVCTPSEQSLEAVLSAPNTNYLYFVARPDFSGYSNFAETYEEHLKNAKAYQKSLDTQMAIKQQASK